MHAASSSSSRFVPASQGERRRSGRLDGAARLGSAAWNMIPGVLLSVFFQDSPGVFISLTLSCVFGRLSEGERTGTTFPGRKRMKEVAGGE